tara:strand:+ start:185 stop:676 length:492 start_codon:yes stop_codon:yes gene_type:complete
MAVKDTSRKPYKVDNDTNVKVGIDLPIRRDDGEQGWFASSSTTIEAVKNNIRNLLQTNQGERLMQPRLGINLRQILFEQINEDNLLSIQNSILDVFKFWLPFVEVRNIELLTIDDDTTIHTNEIRVKILFNLTQDPNTLDSVTVDFQSDIEDNTESTQGGGGY